MVKLPNFDDLKKAGANLMDSAKSGTLVDKLKTSVENIGVSMLSGDAVAAAKSNDPIVVQFAAVQATLVELKQAHDAQAKLLAQAQSQLAALTNTVAALGLLQTQAADTKRDTENKT